MINFFAKEGLILKILVTGAAGFIGSHLVELLLDQGHEVTGIDNFDPYYPQEIKKKNLQMSLDHANFQFVELDLINTPELERYLKSTYHIVIHLAARAGVRPSLKKPLDYIQTNLSATISLLEGMKKSGHKKIIFASSSSVYGPKAKTPFKEKDDSFEQASSVYACSKQAGEIFTRLYNTLYQFSVINLRFFTVYGPRQRPDLVIHKIFKSILSEEEIVLFGDGSMARDYTYVEDILQGIEGAINRLSCCEMPLYETYNLGNNSPITLNELKEIIEKICKKKCRVRYGDIPLGDVPVTYADISKAKASLGYSPKTSISAGCEKMYHWIKTLY